MTIEAKVSSTEIDEILRARYVDQYFEGRLINLPAYNYDPSVVGSDATLLLGEVAIGTGGYARSVIKYETADVGGYADGGVAMVQKATTFAHDGGATALEFSHVALVWSTGNVLTLGSVTAAPASMTDGTYTNIPIDTTSGSGAGLTVDLTVTSGGAATGNYALTINKPGYDYAASDTLTVNNGTLAGLDPSAGAGDLTFSVSTINAPSNAGDLFTAAKTSSTVTLIDGNEAAFYWNLKQYGIIN